MQEVGTAIELKVNLPPRGTAAIRFKRILPESEAVVVVYDVPFGLNVENQNGRAVCTKDGPGGEKVGDVLRYCTQWTLGLPAGDGAITTAASFAGAISWQLGLFDGAPPRTMREPAATGPKPTATTPVLTDPHVCIAYSE